MIFLTLARAVHLIGEQVVHRSLCSRFMALSCCAIPAAATGGVLQPVDKWDLDFGDTQCTAARPFGSASKPTVFAILPSVSGRTYELFVSVEQKGSVHPREEAGSVDFGAGEMRSWRVHYAGKSGSFDTYQYRISAAQMEQARSASVVRVRVEGGNIYAFALSAMPALLDGLMKCTAELQQRWHYGPADPSTARSPAGDVRRLFSADDYPAEAVWRNQQGTAQYELLVDETGAVARCDVLSPSGIPALDWMGCHVIKERAKFAPALDKNSRPIRGVATTPPVTWMLR